ncbi:lipoprotein [Spiroplasma endosymbiont of Anurida maritima]|uniref:lipoprotein n=1 Tax=Spiroplasma endosymbiont of Anurida maritima TaxID=2967972 RepID=UPI0036D2A857
MKKLLSILGSLGIVTLATATVVACAPTSDNVVTDPPSREDTELLLNEISSRIDQEVSLFIKKNIEYFQGDLSELASLKFLFEDASDNNSFPVLIEATSLPKTVNEINQKAATFLYKLSLELSTTEKYSHLFIGLMPEEIISEISFGDFSLQNFNLSDMVLQRTERPDWKEMDAKAKTIDKSFNLRGNFNVNFSYLDNSQEASHNAAGSDINLYLTEGLNEFYDVMEWLQEDLPNTPELLREHALTYEGHKGIESFKDTSALYATDGDITKIAKKSQLSDGSFAEIEKFNFMNLGYKSNLFEGGTLDRKTNSMLYDEKFISPVSFDERPEDDTRVKPVMAEETLMSNLINHNTFKSFNEHFLEGSDGDISFDFSNKESFIEIGLYGNIMNVQNLVNSRSGDGVLWGKIPGVLSYDREYNTTYNYNFDGVEYSTGTGLNGKYFQPLKDFYSTKGDYKFIDSEVQNRLKVQDNYRIDSGSKEGVFTDTTLVDGGKTSINFWTYDNIPLPLVDNLQTYIMVEENKSLNDNYREILSYAYDLLIESKKGVKVTSILSNLFGHSVYLSDFGGYRQGMVLEDLSRSGTNPIILNEVDFERATLLNRKPSYIIERLIDKQKQVISSTRSWTPETNLYKPLLDTVNSEITQSELFEGSTDVLYTSWEHLFAIPELFGRRSDPFISSILYIGGIGFPLNNYNVVTKNSDPEYARWQYGATNYVFVKSNGEFIKPGYSGDIL